MATMNGHHASFVDVSGMGEGPRGEALLDTRHLLGALGELENRQRAGDPVLWQLRPRVPASETDAESLAGFTPAFTPSASTPREPLSVVDKPVGGPAGRWGDAGRGTDASLPPPTRDTSQRYSGSNPTPVPVREAVKRHRSAYPCSLLGWQLSCAMDQPAVPRPALRLLTRPPAVARRERLPRHRGVARRLGGGRGRRKRR